MSSGIVGSMVVSGKGSISVALVWPAELVAAVKVWRLSKGRGCIWAAAAATNKAGKRAAGYVMGEYVYSSRYQERKKGK